MQEQERAADDREERIGLTSRAKSAFPRRHASATALSLIDSILMKSRVTLSAAFSAPTRRLGT
ncbi:MAG TPA: hypothetical protein VKY22_28390 [Bradyrhizobium sp.]|nr:hypothetical protein [Bradyrhizobium sp.]